MYVCVQLARAKRLLCFSIENVSKQLDYSSVVYHGDLLAFCGCCHPTGRWLAILKTEKHGLVEKPLPGDVFMSA